MLEFWQNLPRHISPIIFDWGFFSLRWYSLSYIIGLGGIYFFLKRKLLNLEKKSALVSVQSAKIRGGNQLIDDILFFSILGMIIFARLGYFLFYDPIIFFQNPLGIFWPFTGGKFTGFAGLSFHGGLIGVLIACLYVTKKYKLRFWSLMNFVAPAVPIAIFFVRLGNFANGELWGRITQMPWGMRFPLAGDNLLHHPSQLYEALGEGLLLFLILNNKILNRKYEIANMKYKKSFSIYYLIFYIRKLLTKNSAANFLVSYGLIRFFIEFFRAPDPQLGFVLSYLTMGQLLCLTMIASGIFLGIWGKKKGVLGK